MQVSKRVLSFRTLHLQDHNVQQHTLPQPSKLMVAMPRHLTGGDGLLGFHGAGYGILGSPSLMGAMEKVPPPSRQHPIHITLIKSPRRVSSLNLILCMPLGSIILTKLKSPTSDILQSTRQSHVVEAG